MNNLNQKPEIKNTLLKIASILNKNNIKWGLGGSLLLYLKGINTSVADIDIIIDIKDIPKIEKIVKKYKHIEKPKVDIYLTEKFYSITLDNVDIDLMMGFKVKTSNGIYVFPFEEKLINESTIVDETVIYLCELKDWLEAYTAMGRTKKINIINESKLV